MTLEAVTHIYPRAGLSEEVHGAFACRDLRPKTTHVHRTAPRRTVTPICPRAPHWRLGGHFGFSKRSRNPTQHFSREVASLISETRAHF